MEEGKRATLQRASERLRSERGASLPLVLFLFLICAMAAAIVLAAATASTGRFAKLVESDQLHNSVSSAAGFMKDYIEGQGEVVIERSCTQEADGDLSYTGSIAAGGSTKELPGSASTFMEKISLYTVFGADTVAAGDIEGDEYNGWAPAADDVEGSWVDGFPMPGPMVLGEDMDVSVSAGSSGLNDLLSSKMTASFDAYGDLILTLSKQGADSETASVTVTCQPGFTTSTSTSHDESGNLVTTETIWVTWSVTEVAKGTVSAS